MMLCNGGQSIGKCFIAGANQCKIEPRHISTSETRKFVFGDNVTSTPYRSTRAFI